MRALVAVLVLLALAGGSVSLGAPSDAQGIFATVNGPEALAPRASAQYNVSISGGPSGFVTYDVEFFLRGSDLTGASPREGSPGRTSANQTFFQIDVTAPEREQTVTLVAKVSARTETSTENTTVEMNVVVITPIILQAAFRNAAPATALNVTVRFYVDDILVDMRTIPRINGTSEQSVAFSYLPVGLQPGAHRVRIEADLDGDGRIDPARGESVVSEIFYRESAPVPTGISLLIAIGVFVPAFLVTVGLRRRKRP